MWIFQDGHLSGVLDFTATGKVDVFQPILMFCVAFGLSMDYEVFLLSRIKEEYDLTGDNDHAIIAGIGSTGRIVTAAAVLLAIVFLSIATSGVTVVKMFGVGLTIAVIVDAFLVRATLTPALMKMAGRANWWAPAPMRRFHLRWGLWENEPIARPGRRAGRHDTRHRHRITRTVRDRGLTWPATKRSCAGSRASRCSAAAPRPT